MNTEQEIVMRFQRAESAVGRLGMKIEASIDSFQVGNVNNQGFAPGANWVFGTLDGVLGWVSGVDVGLRMMK